MCAERWCLLVANSHALSLFQVLLHKKCFNWSSVRPGDRAWDVFFRWRDHHQPAMRCPQSHPPLYLQTDTLMDTVFAFGQQKLRTNTIDASSLFDCCPPILLPLLNLLLLLLLLNSQQPTTDDQRTEKAKCGRLTSLSSRFPCWTACLGHQLLQLWVQKDKAKSQRGRHLLW